MSLTEKTIMSGGAAVSHLLATYYNSLESKYNVCKKHDIISKLHVCSARLKKN